MPDHGHTQDKKSALMMGRKNPPTDGSRVTGGSPSVLPVGILALVVICITISAGCIGMDYVANRDIMVIRLDPDGTTAWTCLIDTGFDDAARDLAETPDGGFIIAGQNTSKRIGNPHSRLLRLTSRGAIQWDQILRDGYGELTAVAPAGDGDFVVASFDGGVWRIDPEGKVRWEKGTGMTGVWSIVPTMDGGFVAAGAAEGTIPLGTAPVFHRDGTFSPRPPFANETVVTPGCHETALPAGPRGTIMVTECTVPFTLVRQAMVMKLDREGGLTWNWSYGEEGLDSVWAIAESFDGRGFLLAGYGRIPEVNGGSDADLLVLPISDGGEPGAISRIDRTGYYTSPLLRSSPAGYEMIYISTIPIGNHSVPRPIAVHTGLDGGVVSSSPLATGIVTGRTSDGGYISAGFPGPGGDSVMGESVYGRPDGYPLRVVRLHSDGSRSWEREITGIGVHHVRKVIQTRDGGFAILAVRENF